VHLLVLVVTAYSTIEMLHEIVLYNLTIVIDIICLFNWTFFVEFWSENLGIIRAVHLQASYPCCHLPNSMGAARSTCTLALLLMLLVDLSEHAEPMTAWELHAVHVL